MKPKPILQIALFQFDVIWHQPGANFELVENALESLTTKPDLLILPEMFNTGYTMEPGKVAEKMDGQTVQWMKNLSQTHDMGVAGSIPFQKNGGFYNSFFLKYKNEEYKRYDKKHLFTYANEHTFYEAGQQAIVWNFKGWKIAPFVCYDIRFPVWCRGGAKADLSIYIASFPQSRIYAWSNLLVARAIENQSYVIGVNRVGTDGYGTAYNGQSAVIGFDGKYIIEPHTGISMQTVELSFEDQENFRNRFPFREDDSFLNTMN